MPRLRIGDQTYDICQDCWEDPDLHVLASLAYVSIQEVERNLALEKDGGFHPPYDTLELSCAICDEALTASDDVGTEH